MHSDNTQPPFFGPQTPTYPALPQVCRVVTRIPGSSSSSSSSGTPGSSTSGPNIYSAYVEQWNPGPILRDREECYVLEPNGTTIGPGYYYCRLMGVYANLPLYVTCFQLGASGGQTFTGNVFVTGAVLAGLTPAQATALIANLTPAQIAVLDNLDACQLQTFLTLTTGQQQTLTNILTPPKVPVLISTLTVTQIQDIIIGLTTTQLQNLTQTFTAQTFKNLTTTQIIDIGTTLTLGELQTLVIALTPEQIITIGSVLTGTQIKTLIINLSTSQLKVLTTYPPNVIKVLLGTISTAELIAVASLTTPPLVPLVYGVALQPNVNTKPPGSGLLVPVATGTGPPTWTPDAGTYPAIVTSTDDVMWYWDGAAWVDLSGGSVGTQYPGWVKVTKTFSDFSFAGTSQNFNVYTLAAKGTILGAIIRHTASFTGGSVASCTIALQNTAGTLVNAFDVFQAPGNTVFAEDYTAVAAFGAQNFGATDNVQATVVTTGGNLNTLTAGSVELYFLVGVLP